MTTYNTGNAIGSTDARDLYDNAENFDRLINGLAASYNDRRNVSRKSWAGIESDFQAFLSVSGYQFLGDYAGAIVITSYNQVIRESGEFWRLNASATLPYTTTGTWATDDDDFVSVGDAVLRQELGDSLHRAVFDTLEDFRASSTDADYVLILAANTGSTTGRMELINTGTTGGVTTLTENRFTELSSGEIINAGGFGFRLDLGRPVNPYMFGASSGGANDSTALGLTFSCGASRIEISDEFAGDNISIGSAVRLIYGGGKLVQYTHDTANVLVGTGLSNLTIAGVDFEGIGAGAYAIEAFNNAIYLTSCDNIKIHHCDFDGFDNQAVYARTSSRVYIDNIDVSGCSAGVRFNGVNVGHIKSSSFFDCAITDGTFVTAVSLNSRAVSGGGPNTDIDLDRLKIRGYKNAQGILVHDGNSITITECRIRDCTWGIGCNATHASDEVIDVTITNCHTYGSTSVLGSETGEYGIFAGASVGTTRNITINGCKVNGANAVWRHQNEGGIGIGGGSNIKVYNNICYGCYSNGIVVNQDNATDLDVHHNISNTVNVGDSSASRGIAVIASAATVTGRMYKNKVISATDAVRVSAAQGQDLVIVETDMESVTNTYTNTGNHVYGEYEYDLEIGSGNGTSGSISVKNSRVMRLTNVAGTFEITGLTNARQGKNITFIFDDANISITDGATFRLTANFASTTWDALDLIPIGTSFVETTRAAN